MDSDASKLDPVYSSHHLNLPHAGSHINASNERQTSPLRQPSPNLRRQTQTQTQIIPQSHHVARMEAPAHEPYGELVPVSTNHQQNEQQHQYPARLFGGDHAPQYPPHLSEEPTRPFVTTEAFQKLHQTTFDDTRDENPLREDFPYYTHRESDINRSLTDSDATLGLDQDAYLSTLRMSNHRSTLSTSSMVSLSTDPPCFNPPYNSLMRPGHDHTPQALQYQLLDDPSIQPFPVFTGNASESDPQGRSFRPTSMYLQLTSHSNSVSPRRMSRRSSLNAQSTYGGYSASRHSTSHSPGTMSNAAIINKVSKTLHVLKSKTHGHSRLRSQIVTARSLAQENEPNPSGSISDFQQMGALDLSYAYPATAAAETSLSAVPPSSSRSVEEVVPSSKPYLANPVTSNDITNYNSLSRAPYVPANDLYENLDPAVHIESQQLNHEYNALLQRHSFHHNQERDPHLQFQYPQQLEYSQYLNPSYAKIDAIPQEPQNSSITQRVSQTENASGQRNLRSPRFPTHDQAFPDPSFRENYSGHHRDVPGHHRDVPGYLQTAPSFSHAHDARLSGPPAAASQSQYRPDHQYVEYSGFHNQYPSAPYFPETNAGQVTVKTPAYPFIPSTGAGLAMVNLAAVGPASPPPISPTQPQTVYRPNHYGSPLHEQIPPSTTGASASLDQPPQMSAIAYTQPQKTVGLSSFPQLERGHQIPMLDIGSYNKIQTEHQQIQHFISPPGPVRIGASEIVAPMPSETKDSRQSSTEADMKKKHKCPICDARFQRPEHVKRHLKSHSLEKPYQCEERDCNKRFNRKDNLKAHLKKIHGKST